MDLRQLSKLELRQLCYFMAVVEAKNNFSRAAERLHIQQAPLSQRIQALEKALKVELFDRKKRPLQLTPAGEAFLKDARLALDQIERAIDQAQRASRGEIGRLVVGIGSSMANSLLPDILQLFRARFPEVKLVLRELIPDQQIQELRDRTIDVGFDSLPNAHEQQKDLDFLPILQESMVIALPETHPLAAHTSIPLQALADEEFVLPSPENVPFYTQTIRLCQEAGFLPKVVQEATWLITVLGLVAGGVGVSLLSSNVQNLQRKGVVYRAIKGVNLTREIAVVWRREDSSPVLREFLKVIKDVSHLHLPR
ncbi:MAG TPA: LysR family transcriptional regulator [Oculatellaceae cyanobacterium]|jgi:DNA-binding transcriptional LysR family regulator